MRTNPYQKTLGVCLLSVLSLAASAVSAVEPEQIKYGSLEVVAAVAKLPQARQDVLGHITILPSEELEARLVTGAADLVRYLPGVGIDFGGTRFGTTGLSIRGIGENRTLIEIDGVPVADQFDIGSYSQAGREIVDPELVDRVEILRGPASSLFGSKAIGGVVAFLTKDPEDLLARGSGNTYLGLRSQYNSVDNSASASLYGAQNAGAWGFLAQVTRRGGDEIQNQSDGPVAEDPQDRRASSWMFKAVSDQGLHISLQGADRRSRTEVLSLPGNGRFSRTTELSGDDRSTLAQQSVSWDFDRGPGWLSGGRLLAFHQVSEVDQRSDEIRTARSGGLEFYDRNFFYHQKIDGLRLQFSGELETGPVRHQLGYGFEYADTRTEEMRESLLTNPDGSTTNSVLGEVFPLRDFPISDTRELGIYLYDRVELGDGGWALIPAVRFDSYDLDPRTDDIYRLDNPATDAVSVSEEAWSPKLGVQRQLGEAQSVYLQYARGFRAPPFEDANIGLDIPLFGIRAIPNPDLKAEYSDGYELGWRLDREGLTAQVTLFDNHFRDFIETKVNLGFDPASGRVLFQSRNLEKARIYGAELDLGLRPRAWQRHQGEVYLRGFWSRGRNQAEDAPLNSVQPAELLLGMGFAPRAGLRVDINLRAVDGVNDVDESAGPLFQPPAYVTLDAHLSWTLNRNWSVNAALRNLTGKKYWRWSDVRGLPPDDPLIEVLSSPGVHGALAVKASW
ncbi:MAG: TonB-dependent receptor [Gammaproteobacteria bacterium]|nr:TonB-dependent receptor [Gammaproteobacteria bacterium]